MMNWAAVLVSHRHAYTRRLVYTFRMIWAVAVNTLPPPPSFALDIHNPQWDTADAEIKNPPPHPPLPVGAEGYQRSPLSKPGVGIIIALHDMFCLLPRPVSKLLISASPHHSISFSPKPVYKQILQHVWNCEQTLTCG